MKIDLKCSCGATFCISDNRGIFINNGGRADSCGRRFICEVRADSWLETHETCLLTKAKNVLDGGETTQT